MTLDFKAAGHQVYMIGTPQNDIASSEYLRIVHGIDLSPAPHFDLDEEFHIQHNLKAIIKKEMVESAHDVSEGGLFVALMESAMIRGLGFDIETDTNFRKDAYLFGESQSRVVVSVTEEMEDELVNHLNSHNVPFTKLGEVTEGKLAIDGESFGEIGQWKQTYNDLLAEKMEA